MSPSLLVTNVPSRPVSPAPGMGDRGRYRMGVVVTCCCLFSLNPYSAKPSTPQTGMFLIPTIEQHCLCALGDHYRKLIEFGILWCN